MSSAHTSSNTEEMELNDRNFNPWNALNQKVYNGVIVHTYARKRPKSY